jgi:tetratricopeptide (TPR) repeat protein
MTRSRTTRRRQLVLRQFPALEDPDQDLLELETRKQYPTSDSPTYSASRILLLKHEFQELEFEAVLIPCLRAIGFIVFFATLMICTRSIAGAEPEPVKVEVTTPVLTAMHEPNTSAATTTVHTPAAYTPAANTTTNPAGTVTTPVVTVPSVGPDGKKILSDQEKRAQAVALNYCRASFHRIRKYPVAKVILEERENILNNLNLDTVADPDVMKLYGAVLDEIGHEPIARQEKDLYKTKYSGAVFRQLGFNAVAMSLQVATAQYASAVRTGANSWWDVRDSSWNREYELLKIEKTRVDSVVQKSSLFLETFWKMAQKNGIPDRWLVRDDDIERLEKALAENNLETRIRMLKRLESFMECFPPYWYALARAQQQQGDLVAASTTFKRLEATGEGFFRRDEMLAAGLANHALIAEYLHQPEAAQLARKALDLNTDVWQANLACARVLANTSDLAMAEEAVHRNLDSDLEKSDSATFLMGMYAQHNQREKIVQKLNDQEFCKLVSGPVLLLCYSHLESHQIPAYSRKHLTETLVVRPIYQYGMDDLLIVASPEWNLQQANIQVVVNGQSSQILDRRIGDDRYEARFFSMFDIGNPITRPTTYPPVNVVLNYPSMDPITLTLNAGANIDSRWSTPMLANGMSPPGFSFAGNNSYIKPRAAVTVLNPDVAPTLAMSANGQPSYFNTQANTQNNNHPATVRLAMPGDYGVTVIQIGNKKFTLLDETGSPSISQSMPAEYAPKVE